MDTVRLKSLIICSFYCFVDAYHSMWPISLGKMAVYFAIRVMFNNLH